MLERIALDQNLVDWPTSRKASNRRRQSHRASQGRISVLTARFRNALKKSVEGIVEASRGADPGPRTSSSMANLPTGLWMSCHLARERAILAKRTCARRKCSCFWREMSCDIKPCHWHAIPPPRTLWRLTQIRPKTATARIDCARQGQLRHDAGGGGHCVEALPLARAISSADAELRDIAASLDVCILLGGGDGVLAHIRDLKDVNLFRRRRN